MKSQEAIVKIIGKLDLEYGDVFDQKKVRDVLESVLYEYDITTKETALAIIDNMMDRIKIYIASKKIDGLSNKTLQNYSRRLITFSNYVKKNVEDVTTMDIRRYLAQRSSEGKANTTIATETDIIRGFFTWLENEEYINKSPMRKVKTTKVEKRTRKALTREEFEILRDGAKTLRQKALLEFLYSTGCRLDEVESVNKNDIDWQTLSLNVIGKGDKEREVYINARCKITLKKYLLTRLDETESLFVSSRKPYKRLGRRSIEREINIIQEQSNLNKNVFPHLIRHTTATHLLNAGMDITVLQEILGHDQVSTTQIYASLSKIEVAHQFKKYS